MPDIAASFDEPPSKDGGAVSELFFQDLIPDDDQPPSSPFELMWREAQNSVDSSIQNLDSTSWDFIDAEPPEWPQDQPDENVIDQPQGQSSAQRDPQTPEPGEIAAEPSGASLGDDSPTQAQPRAGEPGEEVDPDDGAASSAPPPPPENSAAKTSPSSSPPPDEQKFGDLVPEGPWKSQWPFTGSLLHPDPTRLFQGIFAAAHIAASPPSGPPFGIGHNGGLPMEDTPAWRMFKARLLRGTALEALLNVVSPTALNRGELEYLATIFTSPYGELKGKLPQGFQAHHLNQNAAFGEIIPRDDGVSVGMRGDAITEPGTPHYIFHQSLERFWDAYRKGGDLYPAAPTNAEYGQAVQRALEVAGHSAEEASYLAEQAADQRILYQLRNSDFVPNVPKRINQVQEAQQAQPGFVEQIRVPRGPGTNRPVNK